MIVADADSNLIFAWLWILAGFLSGMGLGLKFQNEHWLGGYASFKRRMYRLGHISFFGLGATNLLFYLTVKDSQLTGFGSAASIAFIIGGASMPVCCWLIAWKAKTQALFAVPVLSLISAAILTLLEITL
jgi:hypothetical protein